MWCNSGYEKYINNPFCKYLQNVVVNDTGKFGVCECNWSGDLSSQVWGSPILRKRPLKICTVKCKNISFEATIWRQIVSSNTWQQHVMPYIIGKVWTLGWLWLDPYMVISFVPANNHENREGGFTPRKNELSLAKVKD